VGYGLLEPLPDHSSLTRIRDRLGPTVLREFFERIVELCVEANLDWCEESYFDAAKVNANASLGSIAPCRRTMWLEAQSKTSATTMGCSGEGEGKVASAPCSRPPHPFPDGPET
jgi:hypothetical protein